MKITLIGLGNHAKKKIIPTLNKINSFKINYIITSKYLEKEYKKIKLLKDIKSAYLKDSDIYYIGTPIKVHFFNLNKIIKYNKNKIIICEKSLTNNYAQTKKIISMCNDKKIFLIEGYMYKYHPFFNQIMQIYKQKFLREDVLNINCSYTIPTINKNDHRNNENLTGGNLFEIGCYPVSLIYFLFSIKIKNNIKIIKIIKKKSYTFIKFKVENKIFNLAWGYGLKYRNLLSIESNNIKILTNKIFGKKDTDILKIQIKEKSVNKIVLGVKKNNFSPMFKYAYDNNNNERIRKRLYHEILDISLLLQQFKKLIDS